MLHRLNKLRNDKMVTIHSHSQKKKKTLGPWVRPSQLGDPLLHHAEDLPGLYHLLISMLGHMCSGLHSH